MPDQTQVKMTDNFVLFWGGWPSQWAKSQFTIDSVTYNCCEQFMMAEKARIFGDHVAVTNILATNNPAKQKALGRKVTSFNEDVWNSVCRGIVYRANLAKYEQNAEFRDLLMATKRRVIVETSPRDRIWGIGLHQDDPRAQHPAQWRGRNWLGVAIMQVRDELYRRTGESAPELDDELHRQLERRNKLLTKKATTP